MDAEAARQLLAAVALIVGVLVLVLGAGMLLPRQTELVQPAGLAMHSPAGAEASDGFQALVLTQGAQWGYWRLLDACNHKHETEDGAFQCGRSLRQVERTPDVAIAAVPAQGTRAQ